MVVQEGSKIVVRVLNVKGQMQSVMKDMTNVLQYTLNKMHYLQLIGHIQKGQHYI